MIIGLLSDTHGHLARSEQALDLLQQAGAEQIIHCGDLGSEELLSLLFEVQTEGTPIYAVPGNVDEWEPGLILYAKKLGIPLPRVHRFELADKQIALHHGHDPQVMTELMADPDLDYLFSGHTHVAKDERQGNLRMINPGAVYRATPPGVSVLDTESDQLTFIPLPL
ncbi:YfcE family phosphodiesterase [Kiritimatiellota bacterium B12222]|nr:YfcE family phosphodiesterase [Kiritimatiellota bacterium B12222]